MFYRKRTKRYVSLKVWPFKETDVAKLYWIDHPYRNQEGQWKVDLYFKKIPTGEVKKCTENWGTLSALIIGRLYKGGKLVISKNDIDSYYMKFFNDNIKKFTFNKEKFLCRTSTYEIQTSDNSKNTVFRNAFIAKSDKYEFHIPVIEVIRSILARNRKLVYAILEPNSLDSYFILENDYYNNRKIHMRFTNEYPSDLITDNHIRHLLWISQDKYASKSWNEVYRSLQQRKGGIIIPFPINNDFNMEVRYRIKGNIIRIEEILNIKGIDLVYNEVDLYSPYIKNVRNSNKSKKKSYIDMDNNDEVTVDSNDKGSRAATEIVEVPIANQEFESLLYIKRNPRGTIEIISKEDENTEKILYTNSNEVSTSDTLGQDNLHGLEFSSQEDTNKEYGGDIGLFIKILEKMKEQYHNIEIEHIVNDLPDGKKFSRLSDSVTTRKYILAKSMIDRKIIKYIIEVEREGVSLSTLVLYSGERNVNGEINNIIIQVLKGLVDNNGTWDSKQLHKLKEKGIYNQRIRHTRSKREVWELADRIYTRLTK